MMNTLYSIADSIRAFMMAYEILFRALAAIALLWFIVCLATLLLRAGHSKYAIYRERLLYAFIMAAGANYLNYLMYDMQPVQYKLCIMHIIQGAML